MKQSARWIDSIELDTSGVQSTGRLSFLKFLMRYPVFLLAFGPPIFRSKAGIDATKGYVDIWSFVQVGWLFLISFRATLRLAATQSIQIPKQIRSILKLAFFLGILYLLSAVYSPSRSTSAAYAVLYFLTFICVLEFIADVYTNPPNWIQCLVQLRLIAFLLFVLVLITVTLNPTIVMAVMPEVGIRLGGGAVAPVTVICPIIAIISAYTFLHCLESRVRASFFFLVGLAGTLITQSRGCELALFISLAILGIVWAKTGRRSAYLFISGIMASLLLSGAIVGTIGGERIWNTFNRGQSASGIASASGRTDIWKFIIQYCMTHPQGMGYIAGFRVIFREYFALGLQFDVTHIGNAHNSFIEVLADAGWLALAIYLIMMVKIVVLGWRYTDQHPLANLTFDGASHHAVRCALVLLIYCFAVGMDTADCSIPLRAAFYFQNIIIAVILGASAELIVAFRSKSIYRSNDMS